MTTFDGGSSSLASFVSSSEPLASMVAVLCLVCLGLVLGWVVLKLPPRRWRLGLQVGWLLGFFRRSSFTRGSVPGPKIQASSPSNSERR